VNDAPFVALANLNSVVVASPRTSNVQYNPEFGVLLDQIRLR
jgi:hypothetical protein